MPSRKILKYWRSSLIDSDRSKLDIHRIFSEESVKILPQEFESGKLAVASAVEQLLNTYRTAIGGDSKSITSIPVLVYPIVFRASEESTKMSTILPVCYPAKISKNGTMVPTEDLPWIPRQYLAPIESGGFTIGSVDDADAYYEDFPSSGITWDEYVDYGMCLLSGVSQEDFRKITTYSVETGTYKKLANVYILVDTTEQQGACKNLVALYDAILARPTLPCITERFSSLHTQDSPQATPDKYQASACHHGQMHSDFPLSDTQRAVVHQYVSSPAADNILAVAGPPGTGKTTLIQSIVATAWVDAAISGKDSPPIIFIASTNNQAVTNVIDSFCNIRRDSSSVFGSKWASVFGSKWIPLPNSYGLYCASAQKDSRDYLTINNMPGETENLTFFSDAKQHFLQSCNKAFLTNITTVEAAQKTIHQEIIKRKKDLDIFDKITLSKNSGRSCNESKKTRLLENQKTLEKTHKTIAALAPKWDTYCESTPWLITVFEFLPVVSLSRRKLASVYLGEMFDDHYEYLSEGQQSRLRTTREMLTSQEPCLSRWDWQSAVGKLLRDLTSETVTASHAAKKELADYVATCGDIDSAKEEIRQTLEDLGVKEQSLDKHHDVTTRHDLFCLATHYWEAAWLIEMEKLLRAKTDLPETGKSPDALVRRWKRYSKLTPLMVSTLHMLPKHLCGWKAGKGGFRAEPLFDFVDLLIIDEAGQVAPEIAAPVTALAKSILVIGDTQQIEPVQTLPKAIDKANMRRHCPEFADRYSLMGPGGKGIASSSSSAMHIAKRICSGPVVTLTEHRRCVPQIIAYCNRLAYEGQLMAMRPEKLGRVLPPWGYIHVAGKASKSKGSWSNQIEAEKVVDWVVDNVALVKNHYNESIFKTVGIVTPFARQAALIKKQLAERGLSRITVGTVHSFQGGEREVILFSPVYDAKCGETKYFFDQGTNMLNVAVSRAKDSFIVIGDTGIFRKGNSPSGLMSEYLFSSPQNRLAEAQKKS